MRRNNLHKAKIIFYASIILLLTQFFLSLSVYSFSYQETETHSFEQPDKTKNKKFEKVSNFNCYEDLTKDWIVYDLYKNQHGPYLGLTNRYKSYIQIPIVFNNIQKNSYLKVKGESNTAIFFNNQILKVLRSEQPFIFSIDSLNKIYPEEQVIVSVFKQNLDFSEVKSCLAFLTPPVKAEIIDYRDIRYANRENSDFRMFIIVASLCVCLAFVSFNLVFSNITKHYFDYKDLFSRLIKKDNPILLIINDIPDQILNFIRALSISLIIIVFIKMGNLSEFYIYKFDHNSFIALLKYWIVLGGMMYILILLKYILLFVMSNLMQLKDTYRIHYFEFTKMSLLIVVLTFLGMFMLVLNHFSPSNISFEFIVKMVCILTLLRIILLFFKLVSYRKTKYIFIISYLCITDILPYLIGLKILVY